MRRSNGSGANRPASTRSGKQLIGLTEGKVNASLVAEQKAWQAFRDASCAFKLDDGFGEAGGYHACRAEVIAARAAALEAYLKYIDN